MRSALAWLLAVLLLARCSAQLPSERPLGSGPLARDQLARAAPRAFAASTQPKGESPGAVQGQADAAAPLAASQAPKEQATADAGSPAEGLDAGLFNATSLAVFAGDYLGSDRATVRMPGEAEQTQDDPKARLTITDRAANEITIMLIDSSNGTTICSLQAKTKQDQADVSAGQTCFGTGDPTIKALVKSGTLRIFGKRLVFDMFIDLQKEMAAQRMNGSIDYHFEGTRR